MADSLERHIPPPLQRLLEVTRTRILPGDGNHLRVPDGNCRKDERGFQLPASNRNSDPRRRPYEKDPNDSAAEKFKGTQYKQCTQ